MRWLNSCYPSSDGRVGPVIRHWPHWGCNGKGRRHDAFFVSFVCYAHSDDPHCRRAIRTIRTLLSRYLPNSNRSNRSDPISRKVYPVLDPAGPTEPKTRMISMNLFFFCGIRTHELHRARRCFGGPKRGYNRRSQMYGILWVVLFEQYASTNHHGDEDILCQ